MSKRLLSIGKCYCCDHLIYEGDKYCEFCGSRWKEATDESMPASKLATDKSISERLQGTPKFFSNEQDQRAFAILGSKHESWRDLSPDQLDAFLQIEDSTGNFFVTGIAGSGKSHLLQFLARNTRKRHVVVAPTGVAALNAGGQTIHKLFGFPITFIHRDEIKLKHRVRDVLRNIDLVIVDEISMVRADLFEGMDAMLQIAREDNRPFGGVQLVVFGDLLQLPPIVDHQELHKYFADNWSGYFCFSAPVWNSAAISAIELKTVFRQTDEVFIDTLNSIRDGSFDSAHVELINTRLVDDGWEQEAGIVLLAPHRATVNAHNSMKLDSLDTNSHKYLGQLQGDFDLKRAPVEMTLELKAGAQVMLVKNDRQQRWSNGTIGQVTKLERDRIWVEIEQIEHEVDLASWEKYDYFYDRNQRRVVKEEVGKLIQFPLILAWALTIHKSQGSTFDSVALDLRRGTFDYGQVYVALSRCRSLQGLHLIGEFNPKDVKISSTVTDFLKQIGTLSAGI